MADSLDLAPIEARLKDLQAETPDINEARRALGVFLDNAPTDIATLVAEVRRLQADNARMTEWAERAAADENANAADLARVRDNDAEHHRKTVADWHARLIRVGNEHDAALAAARVDGARAMRDMSPTPWRVGVNGPTVYDANGRVVANCSAVGEDLVENIANAARIVRCVNDCAGLGDPARAMCDVAEALEAAIEAASVRE